MKLINISAALVLLGCTAILFSCKKDSNPGTTLPPVEVPDSMYIISTAHGTELNTPLEQGTFDDTVYYTGNRISRIASIRRSRLTDTLDYTFTYNNAGKITEMHIKGRLVWSGFDHYVRMHYNAGNSPDSIIISDSTIWGSNMRIIAHRDTNGSLTQLDRIYYKGGSGKTTFLATNYYRRTAAGALDTIHVDNVYEGTNLSMVFNAVTADTAKLSDACNLYLAYKASFNLYDESGYPTPNFQQFLNPADNLLRSGTYGTTNFTITHTKNSAGLIKTYQYKDDNTLPRTLSIEYDYIKVPVQ